MDQELKPDLVFENLIRNLFVKNHRFGATHDGLLIADSGSGK